MWREFNLRSVKYLFSRSLVYRMKLVHDLCNYGAMGLVLELDLLGKAVSLIWAFSAIARVNCCVLVTPVGLAFGFLTLRTLS